jgi:hypothetical protein
MMPKSQNLGVRNVARVFISSSTNPQQLDMRTTISGLFWMVFSCPSAGRWCMESLLAARRVKSRETAKYGRESHRTQNKENKVLARASSSLPDRRVPVIRT